MKSLFYLVGGGTIAQLITIVLSPILSRIYLPEDFGLFGFITSIVYFINSFSLMRLEIELLKKNYKKSEIFQYASMVLLFTTSLSFIVILLLNLNLNYYLIPLLVFFSGYYNLLFYDLLAINDIKKININRILLAFSIGFSQLFFGIAGFKNIGLILGHLIGFVFTLLFMNHKYYGLKYKGLFKKFRKNILFESPGNALNVLSNHGPTSLIFLLLGGVFGGAYYMAFRIVILPISIISNSIYNYIGSNFILWMESAGGKQKILLEKMILISIVPTIIVYLIVDKIILAFLGPNWLETGVIAKISILWLYVKFFFDGFLINFSLLDKSKLNLLYQISSLIFRILSIVIPFYLGFSSIDVIFIFCFVSMISYLVGVYLVLGILKIKSNIFNFLILIFILIVMTLEFFN